MIVENKGSVTKDLGKANTWGDIGIDMEIDTVADGNGCILEVRHKDYDILIIDLCLPDMNGLHLIKKVERISPGILTIILAEQGTIEKSLEDFDFEASEYLVKPVSVESVMNSIARGLKKQSQKRKTMRRDLKRTL